MKISPHKPLSQAQHQARFDVIVKGIASGKTDTGIARSLGLSGGSVTQYIQNHIRFLSVPELRGAERRVERIRRAKVYLRTGQKVTALPVVTDLRMMRACSRVIGWADGKAEICGAQTRYNRCDICEADLNYRDLSRSEALAVVQFARA